MISEDLANRLKLPIRGNPTTVGTAASEGKVTILGKTRPIKLYLEGIKDIIQIQPYVVKDLAHCINLGQTFLRNYNADMTFRVKTVQLKIKGHTTTLSPANSPITAPSIDTRINKVLGLLKKQGGNPGLPHNDLLDLRVNHIQGDLPGVLRADNKKPVIFAHNRRGVYNQKKIKLVAGCHTVISLNYPRKTHLTRRDNNVLLEPKQDNNFLNRHSLFAHPGVYYRKGGTINILISNQGDEDVVLPPYCKIGNVCEGIEYGPARVNSLNHKPIGDLSPTELIERKEYIISTLKLDENVLLRDNKEAKERLIGIFMRNWDAVAVSEHDYGKTDAMKFHIQLTENAKPVHAKVRPLNPIQEADLKRQLDEWNKGGIIEKSMSPWASALVPCKKKNSDSLRWALDFRKLNELTIKDRFPLNSIDSNLHKLSGSSVFSCLDAIGAFHSLVVAEESRDYTSFVTPFGSYRFVRLPFGLSNAPSAYSRLVQMALDRLPAGFALA